MRCPRCRRDLADTTSVCECGFNFDQVSSGELQSWFDEVVDILETAYIAAKTPWEQSGKGGTYEDWVRLRIPVAEAVDRSGTFLDIGCANGFLLECLLHWTQRKHISISPAGLDFSRQLVELARKRLPMYEGQMYLGNAWDWQPPYRFDYVRTELVYVPVNLQHEFVERLLAEYVVPGGKLLVAQYRSANDDLSSDWVDDRLRDFGIAVEATHSGYSGRGLEQTRIAVLRAGN